jgi:hypothetical protein
MRVGQGARENLRYLSYVALLGAARTIAPAPDKAPEQSIWTANVGYYGVPRALLHRASIVLRSVLTERARNILACAFP